MVAMGQIPHTPRPPHTPLTRVRPDAARIRYLKGYEAERAIVRRAVYFEEWRSRGMQVWLVDGERIRSAREHLFVRQWEISRQLNAAKRLVVDLEQGARFVNEAGARVVANTYLGDAERWREVVIPNEDDNEDDDHRLASLVG